MKFIVDSSKLRQKRNIGLENEKLFQDVKKIIHDVQKEGDSALRRYSEQFDGAKVQDFLVSRSEIKEQSKKVSDEFREAASVAKENIKAFHKRCMPKEVEMISNDKITLGQLIVPYDTVGCYVPSGKNPYPSSVLMNIIPAQIAGVAKVVVATPPKADGKIDPYIAAALEMLNVTKNVYKIGGAQAIAAMAYGTQTVPKVQKIVGPGNMYVATAKKYIEDCGVCAKTFFAGPSDVLIIADETANSKFITYDLLSQAEHGVDSEAVLVTTSKSLAKSVEDNLNTQIESDRTTLSYENIVISVLPTIDECIKYANQYAPEHLQIITKEDERIHLKKIKNAASIFLGEYTPVSIGDYISGTNHILPTYGFSEFYSGLNVDSYLKKPTWQMANKNALKKLKKHIEVLTTVEQFENHKRSVLIRLDDD